LYHSAVCGLQTPDSDGDGDDERSPGAQGIPKPLRDPANVCYTLGHEARQAHRRRQDRHQPALPGDRQGRRLRPAGEHRRHCQAQGRDRGVRPQAVSAAAAELLDYEVHGGKHYARLKPALHVRCRMLLGPMPSEWDTWWQNADGTDRQGKAKDWPPKLPGPPKETAPSAGATDALDARAAAKLTEPMLGDRLDMARRRYGAYGADSPVGRQAGEELELLAAEYRRRGLTIPVLPSAVEPTTTPGEMGLTEIPLRMLAGRLHESRQQARTLGGEEAQKAEARVGQIEAEYQRRGYVIPETPDTLPLRRTRSRRR
jgi:hypothetical protein